MHNLKEQISIVWNALEAYRSDLIPEGDEQYDAIWNDVCTAMAVIEEALNASEQIHHAECPAVDGFGCRCNELEQANK